MKLCHFLPALFLAAPILAADPAPAPLSPVVQQAVKDLSAEDFSAREKAAKVLQSAFADQTRALLSVDDPESQQRLAAMLEFNDGLTRWAIDTIKLPKERRAAQIAWALKPDIIPVIAKIYSPAADKRLEGIRALGKVEGDESTFLLTRLLNDDQRDVYLAAMDAVWDRKPTDEVVTALWQRGIDAPLALSRPRVSASGEESPLRARLAYINYDYRKSADCDAAVEVLTHVRAPQVAKTLDSLLADITTEIDGKKENLINLLAPYGNGMRGIYRLIDTYRTAGSLPFLLKLTDMNVSIRQQMNFNGKQLFISNRTPALITLITITGQKPEDYGLGKTSGMWNIPWAAGGEKEENDAIEKFKKWYAEQKDYKLPEKPADAATSRPAAPTGGNGTSSGRVMIMPAVAPAPAVVVPVPGK